MIGIQRRLVVAGQCRRVDKGRARAIGHQHPVGGAVIQSRVTGLQAAMPGDAGQAFAGGQGRCLRRARQRARKQDLFGKRQGQTQTPGRMRDRQRELEREA